MVRKALQRAALSLGTRVIEQNTDSGVSSRSNRIGMSAGSEARTFRHDQLDFIRRWCRYSSDLSSSKSS